jgi:site-specific recombinase
LESTRNLVLSLFPPSQQGNLPLQRLADYAEVFTRAGTLHGRLDAFVELFNWLREPDHRIVEPLRSPGTAVEWQRPEWRREAVWLSALDASPELRDRYHAGIAAILDETDGVSLFADAGLPNDRGLLPETFDRFFRIVLPSPREEHDLAKLFLRLFPSQREVTRFFSLPPQMLERIATLSTPADNSEAWEKPLESLLDAICLLGARIQGLGLSEKLRIRSQPGPVRQSPFYRLGIAIQLLVDAIRSHGDIAAAAQAWKANVGECRIELETIVAHLDARGVNLDVVYALDVIEKSLARMEIIVGVLVAQPGAPKLLTAQRLVRDVVRGRLNDGSLVNLASTSFRLLARKIVEWAGRTGEHYISSNRAEYWGMWKAALGGGLLTVGTAAIKLMVTHNGWPPFVEGFLAGLNYAVSFVLMQNFHLALATKQPSMTGATLARIIGDMPEDYRNDELVTYSARIFRTQLAAALGNIVAVSAGAVVFCMIWRALLGSPFLTDEVAHYTVNSLNPIHSGTIFYAIVTGVILWLSSLAGGWIENWAVYHQLPRAIAEHRLGSLVKPERLAEIADSFSQNIAGWGGSIVLGFMLGMTPILGHFFGLPLDVRHVTLSTGMLALGIGSLGLGAFGLNALVWAGLGIAVTFVLNLSTSFYLALRLALGAQDVSRDDTWHVLRSLFHQFRVSPREFFLPPADDPAPTTEISPSH